MLNSAEMRIYLLGGDGQSGVQTVNGYQDFIHHISEGGRLVLRLQEYQFTVVLLT